jgi:type VI secretion system protein
MREDRLLNRIRTRERELGRRATEDPEKVISSVISHLQMILNTRQGDVPIAEDYGIPDITSFRHTISFSIREIENSIGRTIEKYEPRLTGVRVKFISQEEDRLTVSFRIHARLVLEEGQKEPVMFRSQIDSYGKIKISDNYV